LAAEPKTEKRLRIAYLSANDPNDRRSWSGTEFSMVKALQEHCGNVVPIGPLRPLQATIGKIIRRGLKTLGRPNYFFSHTISMSKALGRLAEKRLSEETFDVIFSPAGSVPLAHLRTKLPIIYLSDATFRLMVDYYDEFSSLSPEHREMGDDLERLAIAKAQELIYPSTWAANSAAMHYGADAGRIHVVPFGANFELLPSRVEALRVPPQDRCMLLFVGANWARKGAEIAVETFLSLEKMGVPTHLTIVGCIPPKELKHPNLRIIPFLDKNVPSQRNELFRLYCRSHFFILPTRAECFSIALCEANAFGLPAISTHTGGLPELIRPGLNGSLLPLEARGDQYAKVIGNIFGDTERYKRLRVSSRDEFETRLNWNAWGRQVAQIVRAAVAVRRFVPEVTVDCSADQLSANRN
jgi:glycosyltransferase involved in cell wall biosynthesis